MSKNNTIALVGGGTGGPTIPLLATAEKLREQDGGIKFVFIGTYKGPERKLAQEAKMDFVPVISAKWRRYFSLQNFVDLILLPLALAQSLYALSKYKIDLVFSAGGYVAVPVIWAARILGKKIVVHQQDIETGLANRLTIPFADIVTATFPQQENIAKNVEITGNPVRNEILNGSKERAVRKWRLNPDKRTVLIFGGGTGSKFLYELTEKSAVALLDNDIQIIHLTGDVPAEPSEFLQKIAHGYVAERFLGAKDMADAYAIADLVVCRAGLSTTAELSNLAKAAIVVPMPDSHQEKNAAMLEKKNAAIVLEEQKLDEVKFVERILEYFENENEAAEMKNNISSIMPHESADRICKLVYNFLKKN